jgi:hypothetical protein
MITKYVVAEFHLVLVVATFIPKIHSFTILVQIGMDTEGDEGNQNLL